MQLPRISFGNNFGKVAIRNQKPSGGIHRPTVVPLGQVQDDNQLWETEYKLSLYLENFKITKNFDSFFNRKNEIFITTVCCDLSGNSYIFPPKSDGEQLNKYI